MWHTALATLRETIQCPTTRALMMGSVAHSARYPEVVAMLHRRFDKKRLIHFKHCCTLTKTTTVKNTFAELNTLADELTNASTGMKDLGQFDIESLVTSLNVVRLTKSLREQWELETDSSSKVPHMNDFIEFVRKRADGLALDTALGEEQGRHSKPGVKTEPKPYHKDHSRQKAAVHTSTAPPPVQRTPSSPALPPSYQGFRFDCILCNQKHPTFLCPKFINMPVLQQSDHLKANHLCFNCLAPGHKTAECRSLSRCRSCQGRHHTMVHRDVPTSTAPPSAANNAVSTAVTHAVSTSAPPSLQSSLTMTSQVLLEGPSGRKLVCRALLDSGSTISLISTKAANSLQLAKTQTHITFSGIQDSNSAPSHALITVSMSSVQAPNQPYQISAAVVPKVTCDLPLQGAAGVQDLPHLKGLELADPTFYLPGRIDLLLGENILSKLLKPDIRVGPEGTPIAWKTVFGWAIRGPFTPSAQGTVRAATHVTIPTMVTSTDQMLTRFWESEEPPTMKTALTPEEEQVQRHFETTCVYLPSAKRYEVSLPRKPGVAALGDSRTQALQRYQSNERTLLRKGTWEPFQAVIQEYLDLGHAEPVPPHFLTTTKESYYLPMHGVVKASSTSTKLRVVFDASAKSSSSLSLNDTLLVGPTLHPNLDEILFRFRTYRVALTGDISKMYRQVQLSEPDRQLHRFLWRAQPTEPICDYQMNRVTFGVASSPHLAVRTLQQTAQDHGSQHPKASWHVHHSVYVDDLLAGADTPEAAIQLHDELRIMLLFDLRKWRSSSDEVLNHINPVLLEKLPTKDLIDRHSATYPKALGVEWDSAQDTMATSISLPTAYTSTKRGIISDVAKTFDILGWLAPTILEMKILYQQLWEEKLGWDDTVPEPYRTKHQDWRTQLPVLSDIQIPRCYFSEEATLTVELHGFSDASEAAYAAVVYIRATYPVRSPTCRLVMAKTKVAPVKTISVPRLELCGASLLAKLLTSVRTSLDIPLNQVHAWSDSTIVLAWLDGSPKRYKTLVGNRIAAITELVPPSAWKHVPTEQNPADCASRGLSPTALRDHPLWWNGPPWLAHEHVQIPVQPTDDELVSLSSLETKAVPCNTAVPVPPDGIELRCSSYHTQLCVTAWHLRAVHNFLAGIRGHTKRLTNNLILTAPEIASAEQLLFAQSQRRTFANDLAQLKATPPQPLRKASNLLPLAPFLGEDGLIRVGGRLSNAAISPSQKHPVVLSGKDMLTKLLFEYDHRVLGHCGPTLLLSHEGSRLHVLGARS